MGQTDIDIQFKAFIRQLSRSIKRVERLIEKAETEEAKNELTGILEDLQKSLED